MTPPEWKQPEEQEPEDLIDLSLPAEKLKALQEQERAVQGGLETPYEDLTPQELLTSEEHEEREHQRAKRQLEREKSALENKRIELEIEKLNKQFALEEKRLEQAQEFRKTYAPKLYKLVVIWLVALGVLTVLNPFIPWCWLACTLPDTRSGYSDNLLMALWGSATASVIGLFVYVAKYLFPASGNDKK